MEIGFIGLGRMGKHMVLRLLQNEQRVVAWNRSQGPVDEVVAAGAIGSHTVDTLIGKLASRPRVVWSMLPAGEITEKMLQEIASKLGKGDILIDGANSNFHDSIRRHKEFAEKGIAFVDIGVSGGVEAAKKGYAMMAGCADPKVYEHITPLIEAMCINHGYMVPSPLERASLL